MQKIWNPPILTFSTLFYKGWQALWKEYSRWLNNSLISTDAPHMWFVG